MLYHQKEEKIISEKFRFKNITGTKMINRFVEESLTLDVFIIGYKPEGESILLVVKSDTVVCFTCVIDCYEFNELNKTIEILNNTITQANEHGGDRPNSGRPKLGKKKYLITCLPEYIETIKQFIKQLHKPS